MELQYITEVPQELTYQGWKEAIKRLNQQQPRRRKVVYVAGPYRGSSENDVFEHIMEARRMAIAIWQMGGVALCPHLNTMFFGGTCPDEVFLEGDLLLLSRCDAVVMMAGWEGSIGAKAEKHFAESLGLPVFLDFELLGAYLNG